MRGCGLKTLRRETISSRPEQERQRAVSAAMRAKGATEVTEPMTAAPFVPETRSLKVLREAAHRCKGCPLWRRGTQTVFGEGPAHAQVVLVGEQPGDREDLEGRPFVGPAGRLLDQALEGAGIDRRIVYVTNAVKHFKWEPVGKRRLHKKPGAREIAACRPWLDAELALLRPEVVVALGATAAQDLMGAQFRVTRERGKVFRELPWTRHFVATIHPSAILRMDADDRAAALAGFVADLKVVAKLLR